MSLMRPWLAGGSVRPATASSSMRGLDRLIAPSRLLAAVLAPHRLEDYLDLVRPGLGLYDLPARIEDVRRQTTDSVTLRVRPGRGWAGFQAGQHVAVTVEIDGVRHTRCYSPANSAHAHDGCLELTARLHPGGLVSEHLHAAARPGLLLGLTPARGDFVLPARRPDQLLLVSGGSGIAPMLSMLRTLCDEAHPGSVTFLHYARGEQRATYRSELAAIAQRHPNVRVFMVYTRVPDRRRSSTHFSRAQLLSLAPHCLGGPAYVCGPPALAEAVRELWSEDGAGHSVHSESFCWSPDPPGVDASVRILRFRSRHRQGAGHGTVLEQAEAAGFHVRCGCRVGICHTCTARKRSGRVRDVRSGHLSSSEEEDIQPCVSVPVGEVEIDLSVEQVGTTSVESVARSAVLSPSQILNHPEAP